MSNATALTVESAGKVNLDLRVGPRREDGFHTLVSWFCSLGLGDKVHFEWVSAGDVRMTCDSPNVPCDSNNLIIKSANTLRPYAHEPCGASIHLTKRIPMGGGLGGGSSNGAAALTMLARQWKCELSRETLASLAAQLGSDVPFFLHGGSAICRGRGELVTPVAPPHAEWIVLLLPPIEMPTPAVYRRFDEMELGTDLQQIEGHLPSPTLDTQSLLDQLVNDLEPPAFSLAPALADLREAAQKLLGRPVRMSGSGSTLFTLFDLEADAKSAAKSIETCIGVKAVATTLCPELQ